MDILQLAESAATDFVYFMILSVSYTCMRVYLNVVFLQVKSFNFAMFIFLSVPAAFAVLGSLAVPPRTLGSMRQIQQLNSLQPTFPLNQVGILAARSHHVSWGTLPNRISITVPQSCYIPAV